MVTTDLAAAPYHRSCTMQTEDPQHVYNPYFNFLNPYIADEERMLELPEPEEKVIASLVGEGIRFDIKSPSITIGRVGTKKTTCTEEFLKGWAADCIDITSEVLAQLPAEVASRIILPSISKCHCRIFCDPSHSTFTLLNCSRNGTFVDNTFVFDEPQELKAGSVIELAGLLLTFQPTSNQNEGEAGV
uniref:FHA domain-containing protein n=1 Tax=Eutreptiella gymnastica TaxID=73025 RepID=A0A7S1IV58_9EUGL